MAKPEPVDYASGKETVHKSFLVLEFPDPAFNVTLPLGFTLFRWFSVPVDIVPITELPEGFVVDVYLCVNRTDAAPLEMGDCPWMVFQSLSTNGSYPLQVSLTLLTNATFLQEAPKAGLSVVVVVGNANSQWIVIGQSLDLSLLDVVSNVRVLGASGTSLVYNRFPGWELVWDIHPAAGPTIGDLLLVFPLYRRSTPGGNALDLVLVQELSNSQNVTMTLGPVDAVAQQVLFPFPSFLSSRLSIQFL